MKLLAVMFALAGVVPCARADAPASGTKVLYLYDNLTLSRNAQAATNTSGATIDGAHNVVTTADWTLTPAIPAGKSVTLSAGTITVDLAVACAVPVGDTGNAGNYCQTWSMNKLSVELLRGGVSLGTSASTVLPYAPAGTVQNISRTITLASPVTVSAGTSLVLRIHNDGNNGYWHGALKVFQYNGAASRVSFATSTVVNVDSVNVYSAAYPSTSSKAFYGPNENIYVRAMISDPFGSYDISGAKLTLKDGSGTPVAVDNSMTQKADSGVATKTYEWTYKLPAVLPQGTWTARVTGLEGSEVPGVTHSADVAFGVGTPQLSLATSHAGNFVAGANGSYSIVVHNSGGAVGGTTTVTDVLPTGLGYVPSGSGGSGWTCGAVGQTVTCTTSATIPASGTLPTLTINVAIAGSAPASVDNTPSIANTTLDGGAAHAGDPDTATILHPDLSGSTLSVVDLNGGDVLPGDTLRYTLTLHESIGGIANGVSVAADMPANVGGLSVVSLPAGASNASTTGGGANGTGHLAVGGIAVPAGGSATVVYEVTVSPGTVPGTPLAASATVSNPNGNGAAPSASTLTVAQSQVGAAGNKIVYAYDNLSLSRTPQPAGNSSGTEINGVNGGPDTVQTWTLSPAIAAGKQLVLAGGSAATVQLMLQCVPNAQTPAEQCGDTYKGNNWVTVQLFRGATAISSASSQKVLGNTPVQATFPLTINTPSQVIAAGQQLSLRITNGSIQGDPGTPGYYHRPKLRVYQRYGGTASSVSFDTTTVVNVDSVSVHSAPYPSTATKALYSPGETVYVRGVISDPFGSYDVGGADITLTDPNGTPIQLFDAQMTQVADSGVATRTFEYAYALPSNAVAGYWSTGVTGLEGTEGTVTHTANGSFLVGLAPLTTTLTHVGDFVAGANGTYQVVVHNNGAAVSGTTTVTDTLPAGLGFVAGSGTGWSCGAVGQDVTCTSTDAIAGGANFPTLTLTVAISESAPTSLQNMVAVANPAVDGGQPNSGGTDTVAVIRPASSFAVVDTNGGDVNPGDTLQYTVVLIDDGTGASGVDVAVDLPAHVTGLVVAGVPAGSTDASTTSGGANGTGRVHVTGIDLAAGARASIVFNVTVAAGAQPNDAIAASATVTGLNQPSETLPAATLTVSSSLVPAIGNKLLYLTDTRTLTRTRPAATPTSGYTIASVDGGGDRSADWTLSPAIAAGKQLVIGAGTVGFSLVMACAQDNHTCSSELSNLVTLELLVDGAVVGTSGTVQLFNTTPQPKIFDIALASPVVVAAGGTVGLRIRNSGSQAYNRNSLVVYQYNSARSTVSFDTTTVVNVDQVSAHSAAWPSTATKAFYASGETVYVRAVISDPFGAADVGSARLTLTDAGGTVKLPNGSMTHKPGADTAATRTFEYPYTVPEGVVFGYWTAAVTGNEGTEGTVSHTASTGFGVGVAPLSVATSHAGDFTAGANAAFSLVVHNNGSSDIAGTTTVATTLPAGLAFVSAVGSGWSCGAAGQVVTCTTSANAVAGNDLPAIALTVAVAAGAGTSVDAVATVANSTVNGGVAYAGNTDTATIRHPNLSTSSLAVVDLNGGDADPGDTLRYTLTLTETAGAVANDVSVTADMAALVQGFAVTSVPAGSGNASVPGGGANGTGQLHVTGITVPANGSVSIVYTVQVAVGATPGQLINGSATVANPNGPGATPVASTVTVSQTQVAASGNKLLYLYDDLTLTRTPQTTAGTGVPLAASATAEWTLAPPIAAGKSLVLSAGTIAVNLVEECPTCDAYNTGSLSVELLNGATSIATSGTITLTGSAAELRTFSLTLPSQVTVPAGGTLTLRVHNGNRAVTVHQRQGTTTSTIRFATSTVVHVDSVAVYAEAWPSTATAASYAPSGTIHVRARISDPFGSSDVSGADITLIDANGDVVQLNSAALSLVDDDGIATRTFEFAYTLPNDAGTGAWTARVTGKEGIEGTVTHQANASFTIMGRVTLGASWGAGATVGNAVTLTIGGGTGAVGGSSTAPATTTPATASATAGATITLEQAFTNGSASAYSVDLACAVQGTGAEEPVSGTGLSRTITMPPNASVTCTWSNDRVAPLTVVKATQVTWDPVHGTTNPKAIPGAFVEYTIIVTNPAPYSVDADTVLVRDPLPAQMALRVADFGGAGSGPIAFADGAVPSGLSYTFASLSSAGDDIEFSSDHGATWTYVPTPDAEGVDPLVTGFRINPKGAFNPDGAQFTVKFRARIK